MYRFIALFALLLPTTAQAQEQLFEINDDVSFSVGAGYSFIKGDEIVYDGDDRISHLIWESKSPTVTGGLDVEFASGWTLRAGGAVAVRGDSHMEDYDWLEPFRTSFDFEDWTHQSVHPDTRLHHYFTGDLAVGKDIPLGAATLNLHGGIKYTSVHWTAYGGTYTYSVAGFRDQSGGFPDGERGISFQQRYPGVFLGADLGATLGRWTIGGQVRGGMAIRATDTDHHWMRNLRFEERYGAIPFATANARIGYALNSGSKLFLAGNFEQFFHKRGDTTVYAINSGAQGPTFTNAAGMALRAITVSGGFKASF